jgi:hypothetical protein
VRLIMPHIEVRGKHDEVFEGGLVAWRCGNKNNRPDSKAGRLSVAGRTGFEPAVGFKTDNRLAGGPNQPLWHLPEFYWCCSGGGRGIRTPGDLAASTVFKTVAIVHSAIPPDGGAPLTAPLV